MKQALTFVLFIILALLFLFPNPDIHNTSPNESSLHNKIPKTQRILGALEWRSAKLVNEDNGEVNLIDYQNAIARANALQASGKKGALNLTWEAIGPDNVGGRTRAILFDKLQQNKIWVGSVSGGLFVSEDRGKTWLRVESYDGFGPISSIAQDINGHIYVGTGEGLSHVPPAAINNGSGFSTASLGNGIWKSKDGGATWTHLPGTSSTAAVPGPTSFWSEVNSILIHPVDPNIILVAGRTGVKYSLQAGEDLTDWDFVPGLPFSNNPSSVRRGMVLDISAGGEIAFATVQGKLYRSGLSSIPADMVNIPWSEVGQGTLPNSAMRADVAIAPSNPQMAYASFSDNCLLGIYRSVDQGNTWNLIKAGGSPYILDPFNQPTSPDSVCNGQGFYDHCLAVNPVDPDKIYIGGITLYSWGLGYGFKRVDQIGTEGAGPFDTKYIHADKHEIVFDPFDLSGNKLLVGSDGGLTECNNALEGFPDYLNFVQRNKFYQSLQVYGMGAGKVGEVIAGSQDNGSVYIDGKGASPAGAVEITGGDGIFAEVSHFDPDLMFTGVYYGQIYRSTNRGFSADPFLDSHIDQMGCNKITCDDYPNVACEDVEDAPFVYPIYLLESTNTTFQDSTAWIRARNDTFLLANGNTLIVFDTLYPTYTSTTSITIGSEETNTVNEIVQVSNYQASSKVSDDVKFDVTINDIINPGDTMFFPDPYDAKYFVSSDCNLWMCTNPLQKDENPFFYKISGSNSNIKDFDSSADGDHLYYVVANRLIIISGLNLVHQFLPDSGCGSGNCTSAGLSVKQITIPGAGSSPGLEGLSVDPHNPNTVLISQAGFQASGKVWRVENALSASPTITSLQNTDATLPYMPIYDCIIDEGNPNHYILGTELGIWSSDDAGLTWSEDNEGIDVRLPIYSMKQEYLYEEGCAVLYAGTHGAGMYRSTSLLAGGCDPVPFQWEKFETPTGIVDVLESLTFEMYPNPARVNVNLTFTLQKESQVSLKIFDLSGRLIQAHDYGSLYTGRQHLKVQTQDLSSGNLIVALYADQILQSSKVLVKL